MTREEGTICHQGQDVGNMVVTSDGVQPLKVTEAVTVCVAKTTVVVCTVVVTRLRNVRKPGRKRPSPPERSRPDWIPHFSGRP